MGFEPPTSQGSTTASFFSNNILQKKNCRRQLESNSDRHGSSEVRVEGDHVDN